MTASSVGPSGTSRKTISIQELSDRVAAENQGSHGLDPIREARDAARRAKPGPQRALSYKEKRQLRKPA